jgi:hypothetical protein
MVQRAAVVEEMNSQVKLHWQLVWQTHECRSVLFQDRKPRADAMIHQVSVELFM